MLHRWVIDIRRLSRGLPQLSVKLIHYSRACLTMCGDSGKISISTATCAALGEPGIQNNALPLATPATARDNTAAEPTRSKLMRLKNSPKPARVFSKKGETVSIVTSVDVIPVPPEKIATSKSGVFRACLTASEISTLSSAIIFLNRTLCPAFLSKSVNVSPETSLTAASPCFICLYREVLHM